MKKNCALVTSTYLETAVIRASSGVNRRWMHVDASDLDQDSSVAPTGAPKTTITNKMLVRGQEALDSQNELNIISADISPTTRFRFRVDYDIGDIVSIDGNYGEIEKRRVTEFVEVADEFGYTAIPTLEAIL